MLRKVFIQKILIIYNGLLKGWSSFTGIQSQLIWLYNSSQSKAIKKNLKHMYLLLMHTDPICPKAHVCNTLLTHYSPNRTFIVFL